MDKNLIDITLDFNVIKFLENQTLPKGEEEK